MTLVWDKDNEMYKIKTLSGPQRKVNCRWTPFTSLAMLLHPQLGDFRFQLIRDKIQKCVEWLETDANGARFKDQKIKFLNGLIRILDEFNQDDREYKKAVGHFCKAVWTIYGGQRDNGDLIMTEEVQEVQSGEDLDEEECYNLTKIRKKSPKFITRTILSRGMCRIVYVFINIHFRAKETSENLSQMAITAVYVQEQ